MTDEFLKTVNKFLENYENIIKYYRITWPIRIELRDLETKIDNAHEMIRVHGK